MRKAVNFTVSEGVAGYARVGEGVEGEEGRKELPHRKGGCCCGRKEHREGVHNNDYHIVPIII